MEHLNEEIKPSLLAVTKKTDFFTYYRLNLFGGECPFWNDQNSMCGNIACAVTTLDNEGDIPPIWRSDELSKIEGPRAKHPGRKEQEERGTRRPLQGNLGDDVGESCVVEYDDECDDRDYCVPEDESSKAKGDYVSLLDNPEKFTGYSGEGAHMVWNAIYRENCFSKSHEEGPAGNSTPAQLFQAANDLRNVMQAGSDPEDYMLDESCLEKRVFYRVISGMHASISTHICYDYLDQKTGLWGPNAACYQERLGNHPERVSNVYFNYALVLRAIAKLEPYLKDYTFCSGDVDQDRDTKQKVMELAYKAAHTPPIFDESLMFQDPASGIELKRDFRQRFRNVTRLMDCVGCDKCRLWGKLQTAGYGTALKVLFEFDETEDFYLKRTELVALINTLSRISNSISALTHFRGPTTAAAISGRGKSSAADHFPSSSSRVADSNFEDWEPAAGCDHCNTEPEETTELYDTLHSEFDMIWRTCKYILKEWWGLPRKFATFFYWELQKWWFGFLGIPHVSLQTRYEFVKPPIRRGVREEL